MVLIDLNFNVRNEKNVPVGIASALVAGAFMRLRPTDELAIRKLQAFVSCLTTHKVLRNLDSTDFIFFKDCFLKCDLPLAAKIPILARLDEVEAAQAETKTKPTEKKSP